MRLAMSLKGQRVLGDVIYVFFIRMLYHCYINICLFFVIVVCKIMIQSLESLYY